MTLDGKNVLLYRFYADFRSTSIMDDESVETT
jgi:hypothetical protein